MKPSKADTLINQRITLIKEKKDPKEIEDIEMNISKTIAEEEINKSYQFRKLCDQSGGELNQQKMWKLKKKLWPKNPATIPITKMNHSGTIVSSPPDLRELLQKNNTKKG